MAAGIRTSELRKVYNTAPPLAAGSGGLFRLLQSAARENSPNRKLSR